MKPELIIWDWNGTILDDACVCKTIANIMLKERGIPTLPDMDAYRAVFGFPIKAYYEKMGYRFGPDDEPYEQVADEFIVHYDDLYRTASLRPGIVPFLDRLHEEGYRQVLLSATRLDQLLQQVTAFGSGMWGTGSSASWALRTITPFPRRPSPGTSSRARASPGSGPCSSATRTTISRCPPPSAAPACSWRAATRAGSACSKWASPCSGTSRSWGSIWTACDRTTQKGTPQARRPFVFWSYYPFLLHAAGANSSSMGKISSRPKSMSRDSTIFERSEKAA